MTTIAYDGVTIACDGLGARGSTIVNENEVKIIVGPKGVAGFAGGFFIGKQYAEYLVGLRDEKPEFDKKNEYDEFHIMFIDNDGEIFDYTEIERPFNVKPPYAIGSGGDFAESAMLAGATSIRAVEIAISRDIYSGGLVSAMGVLSKKPSVAVVGGKEDGE